mgnify:CR=1 FL=1
MKIVILDGYTENPGDLSWDELGKLGELTVGGGHGFCDRIVCSGSNEKTLESWDFWLYRDSGTMV